MSPVDNEKSEFIEASQKLKSGEYFGDAIMWYDSKYNSPMAERSYLLVIMVISSLIIFYAYRAIDGLLPMTDQAEVVVYQRDIDNYIPRIIPLANRYEQTDNALIEFHLRDYVRARETYVIEDFEKHFYRVRALSDIEIFKTYRAFLEPTNADSPIALYGRTSRREVTIDSFRTYSDNKEDSEALPDKAEVEFTSTIRNDQGNASTSKHLAKLSFTYKKIEVNQDTYQITPMEFLVTSYTAEQMIGAR